MENSNLNSFSLLRTKQNVNDLIIEQLDLLERYKRIEDKVWGSIWLTELEIYMIDQEEFQGLHWKLQLGPTLFVYPDATHTRFEHCLGSLEGAERIINHCNINSKSYGTLCISLYEHFLIRLATLLHDLTQMSYGHTLADEGHLFKIEWKCKKIRKKLLSSSGGLIPRRLAEFLSKRWKDLPNKTKKDCSTEDFVEIIRQDLEWVFTKGVEGNHTIPPEGRDYLAFVSDIIGNTLSGDLVDYAQRDCITLGFTDIVSLRPLDFLVVCNVPYGKSNIPRLVLSLWKPGKPEKMRRDTVSEAVDFFDKRCKLAQKVYFHHAKMAASSMIIKAVHLSSLKCEELWEYGDHQLLIELSKWKPRKNDLKSNKYRDVVRSLASKVLRRHLFKNVFEYDYGDVMGHRATRPRMLAFCDEKTGAAEQREFEEKFVSYFPEISYDCVALYCPDPEMNQKPFSTLVWPTRDETPVSLEELSTGGGTLGNIKTIQQQHREMWCFIVFVDPDVLSIERREQIQTVCRTLLFNRYPEEILAPIWVDNYDPQLREELKSRGIDRFPWERRDDLKNIAKQLIKERRLGRSRSGELSSIPGAPDPKEVIDLLE